jgi:predicted neutral ceramidase superfamily lipid hydrolase
MLLYMYGFFLGLALLGLYLQVREKSISVKDAAILITLLVSAIIVLLIAFTVRSFMVAALGVVLLLAFVSKFMAHWLRSSRERLNR